MGQQKILLTALNQIPESLPAGTTRRGEPNRPGEASLNYVHVLLCKHSVCLTVRLLPWAEGGSKLPRAVGSHRDCEVMKFLGYLAVLQLCRDDFVLAGWPRRLTLLARVHTTRSDNSIA
jgi:hypothetical protein